jgi:DNA-binding transcriptional MerR regulator
MTRSSSFRIGDEVAVASRKAPEAFRSIGEAAAELGLASHVLRFWETRFSALRPMKRPDGRRFYRPEDMELLRRLKYLLHERGLTIRGALQELEGEGSVEGPDTALEPATDGAGVSVKELQDAVRLAVERGDFRLEADRADARVRLESLLEELSGLKARLDKVRNSG